jgi:hypothetical protein
MEASRTLAADQAYWQSAGWLRRTFLRMLIPGPLIALHEDGIRLGTALQWLEDNCTEMSLSGEVLGKYHALAVSGGTGSFRTGAMTIIGSPLSLPDARRIPQLIKQWTSDVRLAQESLDRHPEADRVLDLAVETHYQIGLIHPYTDGNGRVARLAMNHLLRRYGQGYVIYPPLHQESRLWKALHEANKGNRSPLRALAKECFYRT